MFFDQAMFELACDRPLDLPINVFQTMDRDINSCEVFWYHDAHYIKYNGWCRQLLDQNYLNYFLVGTKAMRDPR
jgi:hypothetical protein